MQNYSFSGFKIHAGKHIRESVYHFKVKYVYFFYKFFIVALRFFYKLRLIMTIEAGIINK